MQNYLEVLENLLILPDACIAKCRSSFEWVEFPNWPIKFRIIWVFKLVVNYFQGNKFLLERFCFNDLPFFPTWKLSFGCILTMWEDNLVLGKIVLLLFILSVACLIYLSESVSLLSKRPTAKRKKLIEKHNTKQLFEFVNNFTIIILMKCDYFRQLQTFQCKKHVIWRNVVMNKYANYTCGQFGNILFEEIY